MLKILPSNNQFAVIRQPGLKNLWDNQLALQSREAPTECVPPTLYGHSKLGVGSSDGKMAGIYEGGCVIRPSQI